MPSPTAPRRLASVCPLRAEQAPRLLSCSSTASCARQSAGTGPFLWVSPSPHPKEAPSSHAWAFLLCSLTTCPSAFLLSKDTFAQSRSCSRLVIQTQICPFVVPGDGHPLHTRVAPSAVHQSVPLCFKKREKTQAVLSLSLAHDTLGTLALANVFFAQQYRHPGRVKRGTGLGLPRSRLRMHKVTAVLPVWGTRRLQPCSLNLWAAS